MCDQMNISSMLNPPHEYTPQIPRALSSVTQVHVTETPISAGHTSSESAESQSAGVQMDWQSDPITIEAGWSFHHYLTPAYQRPPLPLPEPPTIESSDIGPLQEPQWSIASSIPGVANIPVDSKSATKKRQESRNNNAKSSQRSRDRRRDKERAEAAIKKAKEMKQELDEERERSRQKDETIRQERERSRRVDAENERLRRQVEDLQKKK
ncbi:hypothetical protein E4U57_007132 [Claviceps arundinis]|uniref:BZIP domain-containing protein n=1 Tax=Claviceps arundinis TaxID=1623583 RepID=A0ABQ7P192_9HYPO|nr:hypothetical protein E4U57_007132 [Claviceps arundinis]